jgi:hypothetical protein
MDTITFHDENAEADSIDESLCRLDCGKLATIEALDLS